MPFTPSHALVALPFIRTPLVPAAIAIGAMTPDLPLFVRGIGVNYSFTHTFANIVWTTLIAFVLFLLWRVILRPAVPELAPLWLSRRLPEDWSTGGIAAASRAVGMGHGRAYPALLMVSLLLGVVSHIVWDLFTHENRWGTEVVPALNTMWGSMPGYKWLQHGSSVLGLLFIGVWALIWLMRRTPRTEVPPHVPALLRILWWLSLPAVLIAAWCVGIVLYGPFTEEFTVQHLAYRVLPPACAVWAAITLVLCVVLSQRDRRRPSG